MTWTTPGTAVAGEVLEAAFWNEQVRDNTNALYGSMQRLGYQTRTTNYSITSNTVAGASNVFSSDITFTADGTNSYVFEFFARAAETSTTANDTVSGFLVESGTSQGEIFFLGRGDGTRTSGGPVYVKTFFTPAAGAKSINVRCLRLTSTGTLYGNVQNVDSIWMALYGPNIT